MFKNLGMKIFLFLSLLLGLNIIVSLLAYGEFRWMIAGWTVIVALAGIAAQHRIQKTKSIDS